ncbi:hypothetical protein, partial [Legionella tunisiensis]|uniref:hypothetical protein n=1 Tax=Legionella tunisiensis TaxID=1034944 RepID=UPI00059287F2
MDSLAAKTWMQGLGIEYVAAVGRLAGFMKTHTKALVQIGIPTSKAAYLRLEEALLQFKLDIFPTIIDELEALEVTLGLKPGLLVEPALKAGNEYYNQLIETLNTKIEEARVKANKNVVKAFLYVTEDNQNKLELETAFKVGEKAARLIDEPFVAQRVNRQRTRLDAAREKMYEVQDIAKAAESFFAKIGTPPENLTIKDRQELAFLYQQFQPYMVARDPQLDAEIVGYLNLTEQEKELWAQGSNELTKLHPQSFLQTVTEYGVRLAGQTLSDRILKQRTAVTGAITREMASITTQIALIKDSQTQANDSMYVRMGKRTTLSSTSDRWVPLAQLQLNDDLSIKRVNQEIAALDDELVHLEQAKGAFTAFMSTFTEVAEKPQLLSAASEEIKEQLRKQYAQFQKYIGSKEDESLNELDKQIVTVLMSNEPQSKENELRIIAQLLVRSTDVSRNMTNIQKNLEAEKEHYLQYLRERAAKRPTDPITLKPSRDLSKGTLLAQAKVYKASEQIDKSIQKAIEFLQQNLAAGVAEELRYDASSSRLPYSIKVYDSSAAILYKTIFNYVYFVIDNALQAAVGFLKNNLSTEMLQTLHLNKEEPVQAPYPYELTDSDSNQAALYKNAINTLYYLKESVVQLEERSGYHYTESGFSRALFLGKMGFDIASPAQNMMKALSNVVSNPQLTALVN